MCDYARKCITTRQTSQQETTPNPFQNVVLSSSCSFTPVSQKSQDDQFISWFISFLYFIRVIYFLFMYTWLFITINLSKNIKFDMPPHSVKKIYFHLIFGKLVIFDSWHLSCQMSHIFSFWRFLWHSKPFPPLFIFQPFEIESLVGVHNGFW